MNKNVMTIRDVLPNYFVGIQFLRDSKAKCQKAVDGSFYYEMFKTGDIIRMVLIVLPSQNYDIIQFLNGDLAWIKKIDVKIIATV